VHAGKIGGAGPRDARLRVHTHPAAAYRARAVRKYAAGSTRWNCLRFGAGVGQCIAVDQASVVAQRTQLVVTRISLISRRGQALSRRSACGNCAAKARRTTRDGVASVTERPKAHTATHAARVVFTAEDPLGTARRGARVSLVWQWSTDSADVAFGIVIEVITEVARALSAVQARLTGRLRSVEAATRSESSDPFVTSLCRLAQRAVRDFRRAIRSPQRGNLEPTLMGPSADAVVDATVNERRQSALTRFLRHTGRALFVRARCGNVARHARGFGIILLRAPPHAQKITGAASKGARARRTSRRILRLVDRLALARTARPEAADIAGSLRL
jgi:hypothetical protein